MNLDRYFRTKARLFTEGRLAKAVAPLRLPMPVYVNGGILVIHAETEAIWILARYRSNLQRVGYARSDFEITSRDTLGSDRMRAVVQWTNRTGGGRIINTPTIAFYFLRTASEGWQLAVVEVLSKPNADLIAGTGLDTIQLTAP